MLKYLILFILILIHPISVIANSVCIKPNFIIAIDVGHSLKKSGAVSARGIGEFHFNKNLATLLWNELLQQGFTKAFLINADGENINLKTRTAIANHKKAHLFIAIHHDSVQSQYLSEWFYQHKKRFYSDLFQGYSIFYSEINRKPSASLEFSHLLGTELLQNSLIPSLHHAEAIPGENRELVDKSKGIYRFDELVVLRTANMPAILLEAGIIVNRDEELLVQNPLYQRKIVLSVVKAVENFCQYFGAK